MVQDPGDIQAAFIALKFKGDSTGRVLVLRTRTRESFQWHKDEKGMMFVGESQSCMLRHSEHTMFFCVELMF